MNEWRHNRAWSDYTLHGPANIHFGCQRVDDLHYAESGALLPHPSQKKKKKKKKGLLLGGHHAASS
jgi:hypothetical protein